MKRFCATTAAAFLSLILGTAACQTAPQPIKEEGWEDGAASAADAEVAPEVRTARAADAQANFVVASAIKSMTAGEADAGGGPASSRPAPVIAVSELDASADLGQAPDLAASAEEVAGWVSTAWTRGKSATWIRNRLDSKTSDQLGDGRIRMATGDFDADDEADLAVSVLADCADSSCSESPARSSGRDDGRWTVGVIWAGGGWSRLAASDSFAPEFVGPADLTGDEHPELIFTRRKCGAHTCHQNVEVLSAHGDERFRRLLYLGDDVEGYGSRGLPQEVAVGEPADDDGIGLPRLEVSGGLVGSAGAGPYQRTSHTLWAWQPDREKLEQVDTRWERSDLRLHRFHDALLALDDGDVGRAREALGEVIDDDELREVPADGSSDPDFEEAMRAQLAQAARFMLARLALERGDTDRFEHLRDELQTSVPDSPATRAVVELEESWSGEADPASACEAAVQHFPNNPDDDWVLDAAHLGYNAPVTFDADAERGLCIGL